MPTAMSRLVRDNKTSTSSGWFAKIVGENYQPEVRVCLSQNWKWVGFCNVQQRKLKNTQKP